VTTLQADLAAAASQRWWNRWTIYLGAALLVVGGFVGGIEMHKAYGEPSSSRAAPGGRGGPAGFPSAFPGGAAPGGAQNGGASQPTNGTVKLVDGTTVYIETESGEVVTVRTNGDTAIAVPGSLKDFKAGDKVTVDGEADSEGTVTAITVTGSQ
jgi:hypothetical protein